jgi:hypothetical protein
MRSTTSATPLATACLVALLGATAAFATSAAWNDTLASIFPVHAFAQGFPRECTGWYIAPMDQPSPRGRPPLPVSLYVTAGHCPAPHVVHSAGGILERTLLIARLVDPAPDLAIGARIDPRENRAFLRLAPAPPRPGTRALVAGYAGGQLSETVVTAMSPESCPPGLLCFHSDTPIRGGLSGAPIVLLDTGEAAGMLIATPSDAHGIEDPYTVLATPSWALRAALQLALGAPAPTSSGPFAPALSH